MSKIYPKTRWYELNRKIKTNKRTIVYFCRSYSSAEVESSQTSGNSESSALPVQSSGSYSRTAASPSVGIYATTGRTGRLSQLARSTSEEEDQTTVAAEGSTSVPHRGSTSNRGSIYASGTQSAYGSRDASPDKVGQTGGVGGLGMRRISPYPAAPPSMIITPSHTPRRALSVERGDLLTSDDIQKLYAKLDAIGSQNTPDASTSSSAGGGGGLQRRVTLIKSASIDAAEGMGSSAPNRSLGSSGVGYTRLEPTTTAAAPPSPSRPTIIPEPRTSSTAAGATSTSGSTIAAPPPSVGTKKRLDKRSASVSPRTARRQFYEDYPYDPKTNAPTSVRDSGGSTSVSGKTTENQTEAASAAWHGTSTSSGDEKSKTTSSSSLKQFFQNVKDKRKLFGSKKSMSVDSSVTHVSIARIGANVLSEPAAPSTYQPPEMTIPDQKKKSSFNRGSASVDFPAGSGSTTLSAKDKEKTSKEG